MKRTYYWNMDVQDTYSKYLMIIEKIVEKNSNRNASNSADKVNQHEIFVKYAFHLSSIFTLENKSLFSISDHTKKIYDYSSIFVLIRAAFESYLTYFYIFCDLKTEDERKYRYLCWWMDGLNIRQSVKVSFSSELTKKK